MIRISEAVLDGHPDKFCDILADRLLAEAAQVDPGYYGQIEVAVWSDAVWFSGATFTRTPFKPDLQALVKQVGEEIGYGKNNAIDASRYRILNEACFLEGDPSQWTRHVNDQTVVIGWAGYDAKTHYLAPEHYLAHVFREAIVRSFREGPLAGQGPDGKLLVRLREEGTRWLLEHVLVTIQQQEQAELLDLCAAVTATLEKAYLDLQAHDSRWVRLWSDVDLLVNPNGPLLNGGSDGDNGQTGRKLVMDYYGPRVPLGGGALSGKDLTHIDRAAAYGARQAAVSVVAEGAGTCRVTLAYAPNRNEPLDVAYEMERGIHPWPRSRFNHDAITSRFAGSVEVGQLGRGVHFYKEVLPWNQPDYS